MLLKDVSIAVGFNGRRLPYKTIRAGATDGGEYRGCLKGEIIVNHFVCVRGRGGRLVLYFCCLYHELTFACRFSLALFEAVDQCNDAVQITGKDSTIMVCVVFTLVCEQH